ncbi:hypothetical protein FACS1894105_10790 [Clostridia bacterium]|nr:hypothetical protein FACS1894105_10790 [Clostridia bacterium]
MNFEDFDLTSVGGLVSAVVSIILLFFLKKGGKTGSTIDEIKALFGDLGSIPERLEALEKENLAYKSAILATTRRSLMKTINELLNRKIVMEADLEMLYDLKKAYKSLGGNGVVETHYNNAIKSIENKLNKNEQ